MEHRLIESTGYMLAQLPSNMLLTRLRPGVYLPCTTLVWSGVSIATAFTTNASSLFAVRFFLGVTEAPLFPGVSAIKRITLMKITDVSCLPHATESLTNDRWLLMLLFRLFIS